MWQELASRVEDDGNKPTHVLLIGHDLGALEGNKSLQGGAITRIDPGGIAGALRCEEDALAFPPDSFDLILACGTLDSLHDLPGALILCRKALAPGGRFLGAMLGFGSLSLLREIVHGGDGPIAARLHPQVDVRAGGDLLARAGFAMPVSDMEDIRVRYASWERYLADLRANGIGNCLKERHPASRALVRQWQALFDELKLGEARVSETFCPVYLSGYAPSTKASVSANG